MPGEGGPTWRVLWGMFHLALAVTKPFTTISLASALERWLPRTS